MSSELAARSAGTICMSSATEFLGGPESSCTTQHNLNTYIPTHLDPPSSPAESRLCYPRRFPPLTRIQRNDGSPDDLLRPDPQLRVQLIYFRIIRIPIFDHRLFEALPRFGRIVKQELGDDVRDTGVHVHVLRQALGRIEADDAEDEWGDCGWTFWKVGEATELKAIAKEQRGESLMKALDVSLEDSI
jgi:hypothetical protein